MFSDERFQQSLLTLAFLARDLCPRWIVNHAMHRMRHENLLVVVFCRRLRNTFYARSAGKPRTETSRLDECDHIPACMNLDGMRGQQFALSNYRLRRVTFQPDAGSVMKRIPGRVACRGLEHVGRGDCCWKEKRLTPVADACRQECADSSRITEEGRPGGRMTHWMSRKEQVCGGKIARSVWEMSTVTPARNDKGFTRQEE